MLQLGQDYQLWIRTMLNFLLTIGQRRILRINFFIDLKGSESGDLFSTCTGSDENTSDNDLEEIEECDDEVIITKAGKQEGRLLFVHQTVWKSRLLLKYGQDLAFLDATYKTRKYALPLFFIAVKTNVDYIIVASFVVQDETTESIQEALSIIKQWNPEWRPQNFMTDLCEEEINALESVFSGTLLYIYYWGRLYELYRLQA